MIAQRLSKRRVWKAPENRCHGNRGTHMKRTLTQTLLLLPPPVKSIILFSPSESLTLALNENTTMNVSTQLSTTHHAPQDFFFCMWLETQPCLTYESVQNDKLFILSFAKVEPLVKYTDCIYYSYSYLILTIFICIEKSICIFVKKNNK